ncbi:deoxyribodipyrimidine photo-lyase [Halobacteriales archaeon SW_6_65_46]|nr:MAG: deoxyribodipyrimidine photo-lyase [Halobacteriales archaeon SW_6_65_46]
MNVFWHQRDLRTPDNRGLVAAANDDVTIPVYVIDADVLEGVGTRQRAFLLAGVRSLKSTYRELGSDLLVRTGPADEALETVCEAYDAETVYYNRHYRPSRRNRQRRVDERLPTESRSDLTLTDPEAFDPGHETHSQFKRAWTETPTLPPIDAPDPETLADVRDDVTIPVPELEIDMPDPGYEAARLRMETFFDDGIRSYAGTRDDLTAAVERPTNSVSRLSPYLAAGMLGIRELYGTATQLYNDVDGRSRSQVDKYRDELTWREYNYYLLAHHPTLLTESYVDFPNQIQWRNDEDDLAAWKAGETGYPLVDAGMRQLDREGYMHNRTRQVTASFLTKHLLVDWRAGARWFAARLFDHDPASNYGGWQWTASTGTDSVDVRIFDPISQMSKYDEQATYVTEYVPELRGVDPERLVEWPTLSQSERDRLAPGYADPIVDRNDGYERAQRVFETALGKR